MNVQNSTSEPIFELIWSALMRRKWLAITSFSVVLVMVISVVSALPDMYRTSATIVFDPGDRSDPLLSASSNGEVELRFFAINQQVLSRQRLMELIESYELYPDIRNSKSNQAVIERMRRDISIEPKQVEQDWGRRTTVAFEIGYQSFDQETVAEIANRLANLYMKENDRIRQRKVAETTGFIRDQLVEAEQNMKDMEVQLHTYRESRIGQLPEQQSANLSRLERLNSDLRMNRESQDRTRERRDDVLEQMLEEGGAIAGEARLAKLREELAEVRTRRSERHPDVIRLLAEIETIERHQGRATDGGSPSGATTRSERQLDDIEARLSQLKYDEERLLQDISVYEQRVEQVPQIAQELNVLRRGYEAARDQYESLRERYEAAQLAETLEQRQDHQFRITDAALLPDLPIGPNRLRLTLMGLFLAFMAAACAVAMTEQMDSSFHTLSDLRAFSAVPVVASIPRIVTTSDMAYRSLRFCVFTFAFVTALTALAWWGYRFGESNMELALALTQRG
jgi:polysaccharide biosynthesis transport protein